MILPGSTVDPPRRLTGFTLLELAVVLIVIGLLLGGVLKGQQVVEGARIKRVALETASLGEAMRTYRSLYHAWPGDDTRASQRWLGVGNGNGNGVIDGQWLSENLEEESRLLWVHLRHAQLIAGVGEDLAFPRHPLGGRVGVGHRLLGLPGMAICLDELPARIAAGYDVQFDDGVWNAGRIRLSEPPLSGGDAGDAEKMVWVCTQL
ncbi:MAG: prepilin-type N-terminal cleavage/methylation domain-containing protein [Magnetococcus sp. YQC-3]